jgi:hypothetical protein
MDTKMTYAKGVECWETNYSLSQAPNTIDGGNNDEELGVTVHTVAAGPGETGKFLVLRTEQWAIDPEDIDSFAAWLKETCK